MRRAVLSPIVLVLGASLALVGCSDSSSPEPTTEPSSAAPAPATLSSDVPESKLPTASGGFGDKPELTFPSEDHLTEGAVHVVTEGDGPVVESGELLLADYLGQVWGGEVFDNSYDRGAPAAFPIGVGMVVQGWDQGLVGQKVGSRVLLSLPPALGYGPGGNPGAGIGGEDTIVFVVDIVDTFGPDSAGQADAEAGEPLPEDGPQVEGELGAPATLTIPEGAAEPTELSLAYVGKGTGEPLEAGTPAIVHYVIESFDGEPGYSTWEQGAPEQLQLPAGSPLEKLVGVPVGSRVLVSVPAVDDQPAYVALFDVLR